MYIYQTIMVNNPDIVKILLNPWSQLTRAKFTMAISEVTSQLYWSEISTFQSRRFCVVWSLFSFSFLLGAAVNWTHRKSCHWPSSFLYGNYFLNARSSCWHYNGLKQNTKIEKRKQYLKIAADKGIKRYQISVRRHSSWLALQSETWLWVGMDT